MQKKRILLVGDHPYTYTGNGNMMRAILDQIDKNQYDVACFLNGDLDTRCFDMYEKLDVPWMPAIAMGEGDRLGNRKLVRALERNNIDMLVFVGLDIFSYIKVFESIKKIQEKKDFKWVSIAPYDVTFPRDDHIRWFQYPDYLLVYSYYGYNFLSERLSNVEYFRPPLAYSEYFKPVSKASKKRLRDTMFGMDTSDKVIFGFVGPNQARKNIPRMLKGISKFLASGRTDALFYLHMDVNNGPYNIPQLIADYEELQGFTYYHAQSFKVSPREIPSIYNCLDVYMNFAHQEGLSWTPLEAMLVGIPCILSDTTAHKDFKPNAWFTEQDESEHLIQYTDYGSGHIETKACSSDAICDSLCKVYDMLKDTTGKGKAEYNEMSDKSIDHANEWVGGCHDFNDFVNSVIEEKREKMEIL